MGQRDRKVHLGQTVHKATMGLLGLLGRLGHQEPMVQRGPLARRGCQVHLVQPVRTVWTGHLDRQDHPVRKALLVEEELPPPPSR